MNVDRVCAEHGEALQIREGVSKKTGKPWKGYFCPTEGCRTVEWVNLNEGRTPASAVGGPDLRAVNDRLDGIEDMLKRIINGLAMVVNKLDKGAE